MSDEVWGLAIDAIEQALGVGGTTNEQVLAESLRSLARGEWVPTRTEKIGE